MHPRRTLAAVVLAAALAVPARAGSPDPRDDVALTALAFALAAAPGAGQLPLGVDGPGADGAPAVELSLDVAAREVVFDALPVIRLRQGEGPRGATWRVERVNLPGRPEPGVAYRDVSLRVFLVATPDALDGLLADARRAAASIRALPAAPGAAGGGR
ncbi:MAG: hypothetical protein U0229_14015 [Anaeromyxobacter sp.]